MPFFLECNARFDITPRAEHEWGKSERHPMKTIRFIYDTRCRRSRISINGECLLYCKPGAWISSSVVSAYGRTLEQTCANNRIFVVDPNFYRSGMSGSLKTQYTIETLVEKFFPFGSGIELLAFEVIAVPIWFPNGHWALGVCDLFNETCELYDSLPKGSDADTAREFANDMEGFFTEYAEFFKCPVRPPRVASFQRYVNEDPLSKTKYPRQQDGHSCGILMLMALECRAKHMPVALDTSEAEMRKMRSRLTLLLATGM